MNEAKELVICDIRTGIFADEPTWHLDRAGIDFLINQLARDDCITISPKTEIGYFAQNGYKFDRNQGVMEFMLDNCDYQFVQH